MRGASAMVVVLAALVAGCSTTDPGQPVPTPGGEPKNTTATEPTSTTQPSLDVPRVSDPLDASKFIGGPCLSLTSAQADELGVVHPGTEREVDFADSACVWKNDQGGEVEVAWFGTSGIGGSYAGEERGEWAFFEPAEVDGYPATVSGVGDRRHRGYCTAAVGTSDTQSFTLALRQSDGKVDEAKVCSIALEVAGKVLDTVKGS